MSLRICGNSLFDSMPRVCGAVTVGSTRSITEYLGGLEGSTQEMVMALGVAVGSHIGS